MNRLDNFYQMTKELDDILNQATEKMSRDEKIDKINALLEQRSTLIQTIHPPFSAEEKQVGKELVALNKQVQQQLNVLFTEVKSDVRTVKKQRNTNSKYMNPYKNLSNFDGMFLDHKK